jgi:hypothetical protein
MVISVEFDELDDDVKSLLCVSDLLRTEEQMMREIILNAIDPLIASGPRFSFEDREPIGAVPHPCAQVDLGEAWETARVDAEACRDLLEEDNSIEATLRVYRNTIGWLRFWSLRFPNAEWREQFEMELQARQVGLERLRKKARVKFNFEMIQELENV